MNDAALTTSRLRLLPVTAQLAGAWTAYNVANREHLAPWNPVMGPDAFDESAVRRMLSRNAADRREGRRYDFALFETHAPETMVGQVALSNVVRGVFQACYLGYSLSAAAQGRGYMTEALNAVVRFAFEDLRLHRIMANYMPRNDRSAAVLRRLGFVIEGTAKEYLYIAGRWEDHVLTSLINTSFTW